MYDTNRLFLGFDCTLHTMQQSMTLLERIAIDDLLTKSKKSATVMPTNVELISGEDSD